METAPLRKICRYTTVPILIDYLIRRQITLLPPASWEDRSDAGICEEYRRRRSHERLLAVCFTTASETVHHWSSFAAGSAGCCLELSPRILDIWSTLPGVRHGPVRYVSLQAPGVSPDSEEDLPFLKRLPYRIESEYRVLSEGPATGLTTALPLPNDCLRRITVTQRMPRPVFESLREVLRPLVAGTRVKIHHSTLLDNPLWQTRQIPAR